MRTDYIQQMKGPARAASLSPPGRQGEQVDGRVAGLVVGPEWHWPLRLRCAQTEGVKVESVFSCYFVGPSAAAALSPVRPRNGQRTPQQMGTNLYVGFHSPTD